MMHISRIRLNHDFDLLQQQKGLSVLATAQVICFNGLSPVFRCVHMFCYVLDPTMSDTKV